MVEVKIPAVGESITSAFLAEWHKQDGEAVGKGDLLLTIETDKVSTELTAESDGVLRIAVAEGEEVPIGTVVAHIAEGGAPARSAPERKKKPEPAPASEPEPEPEPERPAAGRKKDVPAAAPVLPDLSVVHAPSPEPVSDTGVSASSADDETAGRVTRKKLSPLRRKIATQLVSAQQTAAMLTTFNECDMGGVIKLRKTLRETFIAKHGVKLGFMSFFIKAVVEALRDVPQINARVEGDFIIQNHFYDIGVAVGTEKGLFVPVIRDCDQKSFAEIEKDIIAYATKAREGKIVLADLQGGVFTISNGGVYGSMLSTPILNPPQSGILGMHTIQQRPVAVDGEVVIRPMMYLALSYDHRIVDGKEAVTFLVRMKELIEEPTRLLVGA